MGKIKNFFVRIGRWCKTHAPTKRRLIQIYSALLFNANVKGYFGKGNGIIYRGATKYLCTPGLNCYSCPGAVTACPLGALQNAMASSKTRAPYYIIGILALLGLMLGRTICGFLCPTGLGQDLLYKIRSPKLKKSRYTRILSYFKYVLLAVCVIAVPLIYAGIPAFCKYVCPAGTFGGALALLANPANADFYAMLGFLFSWKFVLLVLFVAGSIFIYRFFCRFFCPLGAILGFFNRFALLGVCLDEEKCTECGLCVQTCLMDVKKVGDHECIQCGACMRVCPTNAIRWKGSKIFLPAQAVSEPAPQTEEKPLPLASLSVQTATAAIGDPAPAAVIESAACEAATGPVANGTPAESGKAPEKRPRPKQPRTEEQIVKRNFWLQMGAWAVAVLLLIGALVYYNAFAPVDATAVYAVGDRCPDITLDTYESAGALDANGNRMEKFSTMEHKGTVMVINFWYTTCDPCVEELPEFAEVKDEFGDRIYMVAVHAPNMVSPRRVQEFIDSENPNTNKTSWREWGIIFAQDTDAVNAFTTLGGKGAYPVTAIVDINGTISFVQQGKLSKSTLRAEIEKAMG